ncbi:MAG: TIM barrel protein [Clostridia bacterium]|nr:TIM barrel protein [Clostridia bacterium]
MIKFGPSGNSLSFYEEGHKHTFEAAKWLAEKGLSAFEYSFGRGVRINDESAELIKNEFSAHGIEISVHAPYYTNFASEDDVKIQNSIEYVKQSVIAAHKMGAKRTVFHPASCGKMDRSEAVKRTYASLELLSAALDEFDFDFIVCPETMGKFNQIGTIDEVLGFCKTDKRFYPCLDFGHINSYTQGSLKTEDDYKRLIDKIFDALPDERAKNVHVHFSKIQYGAKGEIRHLTFADKEYGPEFEPLASVIVKYDLSPHIICESDGTMAEDALYMKNVYNSIRRANL